MTVTVMINVTLALGHMVQITLARQLDLEGTFFITEKLNVLHITREIDGERDIRNGKTMK